MFIMSMFFFFIILDPKTPIDVFNKVFTIISLFLLALLTLNINLPGVWSQQLTSLLYVISFLCCVVLKQSRELWSGTPERLRKFYRQCMNLWNMEELHLCIYDLILLSEVYRPTTGKRWWEKHDLLQGWNWPFPVFNGHFTISICHFYIYEYDIIIPCVPFSLLILILFFRLQHSELVDWRQKISLWFSYSRQIATAQNSQTLTEQFPWHLKRSTQEKHFVKSPCLTTMVPSLPWLRWNCSRSLKGKSQMTSELRTKNGSLSMFSSSRANARGPAAHKRTHVEFWFY